MKGLQARPRAIRLFALLWLVQAALFLVYGLLFPETVVTNLAARWPDFDWGQPAPLIVSCTRAAIALLPLWLILTLASKFARAMVTLLAVLKLPDLASLPEAMTMISNGNPFVALWLGGTVAAIVAVHFLFYPEAWDWFRNKGRIGPKNAEVFI